MRPQLFGALLVALASVSGLASAQATVGDSAQLTWTAEQLELGEPFALHLRAFGEVPAPSASEDDVLVLERQARTELRARTEAFALDAEQLEPTFAVLEESPVVITREATELGARLVAERSWRLVALEPGSFDMPLPVGTAPLAPDGRRLVVGGVLGEDEDVARPAAGFLEVPELEAPGSGARWSTVQLAAVGIGTSGVLAGAVLLLARRRRASSLTQTPPAERLERLAALAVVGSGATPAELTAAHYGLTAILRRGLVGVHRLGRSRIARSLTDAEWAAGLPPELADAGALFEDCARVKYAGEAPTAWALSERLGRARRLLELAEAARQGGPS
ncbi:MAG: hypothetical protein P1V81_00560 [Planctomycetota bacterium]|nr:hypothetical protein [Planctomycetota bacterium]